jgi:hypothetical protein
MSSLIEEQPNSKQDHDEGLEEACSGVRGKAYTIQTLVCLHALV